MTLDSTRGLKAKLVKEQLRPLTLDARRIAALAIGARAISEVDATQRTIALGVARTGTKDFRLAVRIQSRALEKSPQVEAITKHAKGEVEIRYIGRVVKRAAPWNQSRQRPLLIGVSIGHFRITAGTLGCFVRTRSGGAVRILSNNHVLADENAGKKGDAVIQPGRFDGGKKGPDRVGALERFVRLAKGKTNFVDGALASLRDGIEFDARELRGLGRLSGQAGPAVDVGDRVHKVGRTTDLTHGRVTAFELDNVVVSYDLGNLRFDDQIEIEGAEEGPFSQGGDSGSLIVNDESEAAALLFAGGDQGGANGQGLTYANPIGRVFDDLGIDLL